MLENKKPILFFDGHCNLCNGSIDYLVSADKNKRVMIASLQGETAKAKLPPEQINKLSSVVLLDEQGQIHLKSSAVFKVALRVKRSLILLTPFWILPRFFTDWVYDRVANNRYKMFGQKDTCRIPTEEEKAHFLP